MIVLCKAVALVLIAATTGLATKDAHQDRPPTTRTASAADDHDLDWSPFLRQEERDSIEGFLQSDWIEAHVRALTPYCGLARLLLYDIPDPRTIPRPLQLLAAFVDFRPEADGVRRAQVRTAGLHAYLNRCDLESRFEALQSFAFINVNDNLIDSIIEHCRPSISDDLIDLADIDTQTVRTYLEVAFPCQNQRHRDLLRSALLSDLITSSAASCRVLTAAAAQTLIGACSISHRPYLCSDYLHHLEGSWERYLAVLEPMLTAAYATGEAGYDLLQSMLLSMESQLDHIPPGRDGDQIEADLIYASLYFCATERSGPRERSRTASGLSRLCAGLAGVRDRPPLIAAVAPHLERVIRSHPPDVLRACWPAAPFGLLSLLNDRLQGTAPSSFGALVAAVALRTFANIGNRIQQIVAYLDQDDPAEMTIMGADFLFAGLTKSQTIKAIVGIFDAILSYYRTPRNEHHSSRKRAFFTELATYAKPFWDELLDDMEAVVTSRSGNPLFSFLCIVLLQRAKADSIRRPASAHLLRAVVLDLGEDPVSQLVWSQLPLLLPRLDVDQLCLVLPALLPNGADADRAAWALYDGVCAGVGDRAGRASLYLSALRSIRDLPTWLRHYRPLLIREVETLGVAAFFMTWRPSGCRLTLAWRCHILWMLWANQRGRLLTDADLVEIVEQFRFTSIEQSERPLLANLARAVVHLILYLLPQNPDLNWIKSALVQSFLEQDATALFRELSAKLITATLTPSQRRQYADVRRIVLLEMIQVRPHATSQLFLQDLVADGTASSWLHICLDHFLSQYDYDGSGSATASTADLLSKATALLAIMPTLKSERAWLQNMLFGHRFTGPPARLLAAVLAHADLTYLRRHQEAVAVRVRALSEQDLRSDPDRTRRIFCGLLRLPVIWTYPSYRADVHPLLRHVPVSRLLSDSDLARGLRTLRFPALISIVHGLLSVRRLDVDDRCVLSRVLMAHPAAVVTTEAGRWTLPAPPEQPPGALTAVEIGRQTGHLIMDLRHPLDERCLSRSAAYSALGEFLRSVAGPTLSAMFDDDEFRVRVERITAEAQDRDLRAIVAAHNGLRQPSS